MFGPKWNTHLERIAAKNRDLARLDMEISYAFSQKPDLLGIQHDGCGFVLQLRPFVVGGSVFLEIADVFVTHQDRLVEEQRKSCLKSLLVNGPLSSAKLLINAEYYPRREGPETVRIINELLEAGNRRGFFPTTLSIDFDGELHSKILWLGPHKMNFEYFDGFQRN